MQAPDHVEDPVLVIQGMVQEVLPHGLRDHIANITSSKAPGQTFGPALAWHILCVHTFCSLEEFTITAFVESQHTSSSYTIFIF